MATYNTPDRSTEAVGFQNREPYINGATVAAIQTVFNRSRLSHQGWEANQLAGRLDSRRAWRYEARGNVDIFRERRMPSPTKLNVHLLVDASGSMMGHRACRAQDMAGTIVEAFKRIPTVRVHVWQHNASLGVTNVYNVARPGKANTINTMLMHIAGGNADGFALEAIGGVIAPNRRPDEGDLIIVISDGLPSVTVQGATGDILDHSTIVCNTLRSKGIEVIGVAIAGDDRAHRRMYGAANTVGFNGDWAKLSRDFSRVFGAMLRPANRRAR